MNTHWQAIHFVDGQTVAEFVKQFDNLEKDRTINWSALGGTFEKAKKVTKLDGTPANDGVILPLSEPVNGR